MTFSAPKTIFKSIIGPLPALLKEVYSQATDAWPDILKDSPAVLDSAPDNLCTQRIRFALKYAKETTYPGQQVYRINTGVNHALEYRHNPEIHPWKSFRQTLIDQYGDCEDIALAKYWTLIYFGIPQQALSLVGVKIATTGKYHMIVMTNLDGKNIIFDNIKDILEFENEVHYQPLFTLNSELVFGNFTSLNDQLKEE